MYLNPKSLLDEAKRRANLACAQSNDWSDSNYKGLIEQFMLDIIEEQQENERE